MRTEASALRAAGVVVGLWAWLVAIVVSGRLLVANGLPRGRNDLMLAAFLALLFVSVGIPILLGLALLRFALRRRWPQVRLGAAEAAAVTLGVLLALSGVAYLRCQCACRIAPSRMLLLGGACALASFVSAFIFRFLMRRRRLAGALGVAIAIASVATIPWGGGHEPPVVPPDGTALAASNSQTPREPVLLIGFDGLDPGILRRLMSAGRLPTFQRMAEEGFIAPSATLTPTLSPAIWTTIATGRLPRDHGVLGFFGIELPGIRGLLQHGIGPGCGDELFSRGAELLVGSGLADRILTNSRFRRTPALWNVLSSRNRTVLVVNWWASWPAEPVLGEMVSDRFQYVASSGEVADDGETVYPPDLFERIRPIAVDDLKRSEADEIPLFEPTDARDPGHFKTHESFPKAWQAHREGLALSFSAADRTYLDVASALIRTRRQDFSAVYFRGVDVTSHLMGEFSDLFPEHRAAPAMKRRYGHALEAAYLRADRQLAHLLELAGPETTVIVCSDHGFAWEPSGKFDHVQTAPQGVLILRGPRIEPGARGAASVVDLAPTVLYLMGEPIARDMPGKIVDGAFRTGVMQAFPATYVASFEGARTWKPAGQHSPLDSHILEELKSLGYVK